MRLQLGKNIGDNNRPKTVAKAFAGFAPSVGNVSLIDNIIQNSEFMRYYKTPEDISEFKNYIVQTQLQGVLGDQSNVFKIIDNGKAIFNPNAKPLELMDTDTPEVQAFKAIHNELVAKRGKVREPSFIEQAISNSMTAGWLNLMGKDMAEPFDGFGVTKDGYTFKGEKLNLNPSQARVLGDFVQRLTGQAKNDTMLDKIGRTALSLTFDLPLMFLTGGIASGIVNRSAALSVLTKSTDMLPRLLGQAAQQAINFNILGIPQTVNAIKNDGISGSLDAIFNNTLMGVLAATTGTLGATIPRITGLSKAVLKNRPAMVEELGGIAGSFGFGYTSSKIGGESDEDAIATGLAFAATHFTNPTAYRRVIKEQASKNIRILTDKFDGRNKYEFQPDYYIEENNRLHLIDKDAFNIHGLINKVSGVEPLIITKENRDKVGLYNEMFNHNTATLGESLIRQRTSEMKQLIYRDWTKNLPKDYVDEYNAELRTLADVTATSLTVENELKLFKRSQLPDDATLKDFYIKLANDREISYSDIKQYVAHNIPEFLSNPDKFGRKIKEGNLPEVIAKDLETALEKTAETIIKKSYSSIPIIAVGQAEKIAMPNELVNIKGEPIKRPSGKTLLTSAEIRAGKKPTDIITVEKQYDRYDILGKPVDVERLDNGNIKVRGSDIEFKPDEEKFIKYVKEENYNRDELERLDVNDLIKVARNLDLKMEINDLNKPNAIELILDRQEELLNASRIRENKNIIEKTAPELVGEKNQRGSSKDLEQQPQGERIGEPAQGNDRKGETRKEVISTEKLNPETAVNEGNRPEQPPVAQEQKTKKGIVQVKKEKNFQPTKPGEEIFRETEKSLKNLAEYLKKREGKGFNISIDKDIAPDIEKIKTAAIQRSNDRNKELAKIESNLTKSGKLKRNKLIDPEISFIELVTPYTKNSSELASLVRQAYPNSIPRYRDASAKTIDNIYDQGQLKDIKRKHRKTVIKESNIEESFGRKDEDIVNEMVSRGIDRDTAELIAEETNIGKVNQEKGIGAKGSEIAEKTKASRELGRFEEGYQPLLDKQNIPLDATERFIDYMIDQKEKGVNKTIEEHLKNAIADKIILPNQEKKIKDLYSEKSIKQLFEQGNARGIIEKAIVPKLVEEFNKEYGEYGVTAKFDLLEQPSDKNKRTFGVTLFNKDGTVEIKLDERFADRETFTHEKFHTLLNLLADETTRSRLLKQYGWDGIEENSYSWIRANEELYNAYKGWRNGYREPNTLFGKLRKFIEKLSNWFKTGRFGTTQELFFRDFDNGELKLSSREKFNTRNIKLFEDNIKPILKKLDSSTVRTTFKAFNFFKKPETLVLNQSFFNRLDAMSGVKKGEKEFIKHIILKNGLFEKKISSDEFRRVMMENMYPIKINTVTRTLGAWKEIELEKVPDDVMKEIKRLISEGVDVSDTITDSKGNLYRYVDYETEGLTIYKVGNYPVSDYISYTAKYNPDTISFTGSYRENYRYRVYSVDLPIPIHQIHDYWNSRDSSLGWFRTYDDNNGKTLVVNEIQSQFQYAAEGNQILNTNMAVDYANKDYVDGGWVVKIDQAEKFLDGMKPVWHEHFIRSIIQFAADSGYKTVRFPTAKSITKIEGFDDIIEQTNTINNALDNYILPIYDKIQNIAKENNLSKNDTSFLKSEAIRLIYHSVNDMRNATGDIPIENEYSYFTLNDINGRISGGINPLEAFKESIDGISQHLAALQKGPGRTIEFYEKDVKKYLEKYRKNNLYRVSEEIDGKTIDWLETRITDDDNRPIALFELGDKRDYELDPEQSTQYWNDIREANLIAENVNEKKLIRNILRTKLFNPNIVTDKAKEAAKFLWDSSLPPTFTRYRMPKFAPVRDEIESNIIRASAQAFNTIWEQQWNKGDYLREIGDTKEESVKLQTEFMSKLEAYNKDLYDNGIKDRELTDKELYEKYKFTDKEIRVKEAYKNAVNKAIEQQKIGDYKMLMEHENNLAGWLNRKKFIEFFPEIELDAKGQPSNENYKKANEILKNEIDRKSKIAKYIVDKRYKFDDKAYTIGTRPILPEVWIIDMAKPSDNPNHSPIKNDDGKIIGYEERYDTYAYNEKAALDIIKEKREEGFLVKPGGFYNIGKVLKQKNYREKLTPIQLNELANRGFIPLDNEVLAKLRDAFKVGTFEQHTLHKNYIPGMHFTPFEYEFNLERFIQQGVAGNFKRNTLIKLNNYMADWEKEIDTIKRSKLTTLPGFAQLKALYNIKGDKPTDAEISRIEQERQYALKYINNTTFSDKNVIDIYRGMVSTFMTALKPSFYIQQLLQPFQTSWSLAIAEAKQYGIKTSATKMFMSSVIEAKRYMSFIRLMQKAEDLMRMGRDKEAEILAKQLKAYKEYDVDTYKVYKALNRMRKLGKVGIAELFDERSELIHHYSTGGMRLWDNVKKAMNSMSGGIEKLTRVQTLLTFDKIANGRKLSIDDKIKYLADKLDEGMSEFGVGGRAPILSKASITEKQHQILKAINKGFMTFKTFTTHNLGLYDRLIREKQWGALGIKLSIGMGLHGITKFPLIATVFALASLFTDDDPEYKTLELLDTLDGDIPFGKILGKGTPALLGIDMRNLMSETSMFAPDLISETRAKSFQGKLAEAMFGAPYGYAQSSIEFAKGLRDTFAEKVLGELKTKQEKERIRKQIFAVAPLALQNILKAFIYERDGVALKGRTIIKRDDISYKDIFYKALGFSPLDIAETYENIFYGFPAKYKRAKGRVAEIKRIRKEIRQNDKYTTAEKTQELLKVAKELKKAMQELRKLKSNPEYGEARRKHLIK